MLDSPLSHRSVAHPRVGTPRVAAAALVLATMLVALASTTPAGAAEVRVEVRNNFFDPREVVIEPGDTVTWTNVGRGVHNVVADDGSFRCAEGCDATGGDGDPSTAAWEVSVTFDEAGENPYFCEAHGGPGGVGMAGRVTVREAAGGGGGTLRFVVETVEVGEGDGAAPIRVERVDGTDGAVSVEARPESGDASAGLDYRAIALPFVWADGEGGERTADLVVFDDSDVEGTERVNLVLRNPDGVVTIGEPDDMTVRILDDDRPLGEGPVFAFERPYAGGVEGQLFTVDVVNLGGRGDASVSLDLETTDGSALGGVDYGLVPDSIVFTPGDERESFQILPLDDEVAEPPESFTVTLRSDDPAAFGFPATLTVVLLDDDAETGGPLTADQVTCDAFRLHGLLERLDARAPGSGGPTGLNLSLTGSGDFAGLAYTENGPRPEAHLAFSTNPEETTLLRNPARPQLFAISLTRNQTNSDLVAPGSPDELEVVLNPTLDLRSPDPATLLVIDDLGDPITRTGGTPAESKPGRGLAGLLEPCHDGYSDFDVHVLRVLTKIARGLLAGGIVDERPVETEIALYRGEEVRTYRLDVLLRDAAGTRLGLLAALLELEPGATLTTGILRVLPPCPDGQSAHCTRVERPIILELVRPTAPGELWQPGPYRVSATPGGGGTAQVLVDFEDLLEETRWRRPLE